MKNLNPKISVLMPAYNAEKFIDKAIKSILSQTFTDFEFIIINDGSTDNTEEIILSFTDSRIRYVKNETNIKLIQTLNKGIELARGKYIARMDSDDISTPQRLELQYQFMEGNPHIGASSGLIYTISEDGNKIGHSNQYLCTTPTSCIFSSLLRTPISHPSAFIRTDILKKIKYSNDKAALHIEAFVLWGDIIENGYQIAILEKPLVYYRNNSQSISHKYKELQMRNHAKFSKIHIERCLNMKIEQKAVDDLFITDSTITIRRLNMALKQVDNLYHKFTEKYELTNKELTQITQFKKEFKKSILLRNGKRGPLSVKIISMLQLIKLIFS